MATTTTSSSAGGPARAAGETAAAPRRQRAWERAMLAVAVLAALRYAYILGRFDAYGIAKFFTADDSFYYFLTARHLAQGLGSTFDGVHVTNGYHPLWFLVSAAAFRLFPGATAPLVALYALQAAMVVAAGGLLYLALRPLDRRAAAATAALFTGAWSTRTILFNGMEGALAFLLAAGLLAVALRRPSRFLVPASGRDALIVFLLLLGLSLARLEAGLVAGLWLAIAFAVDARRGGGARGRIALVGLGLALAAAAYVAVNLRLVGMPFPVSGLIKAGSHPGWALRYAIFTCHRDAFAGPFATPGRARWSEGVKAVEALALLAALAAFLVRLRRRDPERALALVPFLGFALVFVGFSSIVTHGGFTWYLWPALFAGTLATFALLQELLRRRAGRPVLAALAVVALGVAAAGWAAVAKPRNLTDWGMRGFVMDSTVRFIREQIPAGDRIGGMSSGMFTYFSGRDVENLEGLANGADFFRARNDPRLYGNYLRRNRIRWIVFRTTAPGEREAVLGELERVRGIERVYDLASFYHLDMKRAHPDMGAPNIYFVRLAS